MTFAILFRCRTIRASPNVVLIAMRKFPAAQCERLLQLTAAYFDILPAGPFEARVRQIERIIDATYLCWIDGSGDDDPFYYRI